MNELDREILRRSCEIAGLEQSDVCAAYIYGSRARGDVSTTSNYDVAIVRTKEFHPELLTHWRLGDCICKVDVFTTSKFTSDLLPRVSNDFEQFVSNVIDAVVLDDRVGLLRRFRESFEKHKFLFFQRLGMQRLCKVAKARRIVSKYLQLQSSETAHHWWRNLEENFSHLALANRHVFTRKDWPAQVASECHEIYETLTRINCQWPTLSTARSFTETIDELIVREAASNIKALMEWVLQRGGPSFDQAVKEFSYVQKYELEHAFLMLYDLQQLELDGAEIRILTPQAAT